MKTAGLTASDILKRLNSDEYKKKIDELNSSIRKGYEDMIEKIIFRTIKLLKKI